MDSPRVADRVLIEAALNGSRALPAPLQPDEAAEEGRRAVEAGAAMVHVHARALDGSDSSDPGWYGAFLERFRASCPGVAVSVTTKPSAALLENVRAWDPPPEACSVNVGSRVEPWQELLAVARGRGLAVEAGAADAAMIDALCGEGGRFWQLVLLVAAEAGTRQATAARYLELAARARAGGFREPIIAHGYGDATWGVVGTALVCGDDVRVGFEDSFTLPTGAPARSNGELVAAAVRMATAAGRIPLEPSELAALRRPGPSS